MCSNDKGTPSLSREDSIDCAICMQPCLQPVKFPCNHIFCFLCAKGIACQSRCCALCRAPIPNDFIRNPNNFKHASKQKIKKDDNNMSKESFVWFYQGYQGWWQYDERSSSEIEEAFQNQNTSLQILIAGNLYHIDLVNMQQYQVNRASRKRAIKRDKVEVQKKGVAGMVDESCTPSTSSTNMHQQAPGIHSTQLTNVPNIPVAVVDLSQSIVRPVVDLSQSNVRAVVDLTRTSTATQSTQPLDLSMPSRVRSLSNQPDVVTSTLRMMPVGSATNNIYPHSGVSQDVEIDSDTYSSCSDEEDLDDDGIVPMIRSLSSNIDNHHTNRSSENGPNMMRSNTLK